MRSIAALALSCLLVACATVNQTERTLHSFTGRTISDFINERHAYPDSKELLPNGNLVYRFHFGSTVASVDERNHKVIYQKCEVWIETKQDVIVHWRFSDCS
jgi:hypothetical protein